MVAKARREIFLMCALSAAIPVIANAQDAPHEPRPYGGTLIWGVCTKPTIINPILTSHSISAALLDLIFNHLVRLNAKGELEPDLAERWDISADGLSYTFYLRKGVRFHDGQECTAEDVKFTFDKMMDPAVNSPFQPSFELVRDCKVIDAYTFQVNLKKPSVIFIYRLLRSIAPKHLLENVDLKDCPFNSHPVGTGPFCFKGWTKDGRIILEYNPDYYEGRPYLDEIEVKVYPTVRDVWIAMMRGEVDYAGFIEREDYEVSMADQAFKAYAFPMDSYYALFYNPDDPVVADKRVREAIAYGIDRKDLIEKVAGGYGVESNGPFYPGSIGSAPQVQPYAYNPERSLALLAEAGWQDKNGDGIFEKKGQDLELKVLVDARNEISKKIAMLVRQQLQEIGIRLRVLLYDDDSRLTNEFLKENKPNAELRLFFGGEPAHGMYNWSSKNPKRSDRLWGYRNPEVDRFFEEGEVIWEVKKRQVIYRKAGRLIYEDQPACFLYFPFVFHALSGKFSNTDDFFNINMPTYTIKDWYITSK